MTRRVSGEGWISAKPRKDGLWTARYTTVGPDGRSRRPVLYARTRAEVAQKLREALASRDRGQRPAPARETVAEYLATWHEGRRPQIRSRSWDREGEHVRLHLAPLLGKFRLSRLRPDDVQRAYGQLIAQGLAPATVRRVHNVLHAALEQAVRWRRLQTNVAGLVAAPRIPRREMTALSPEQARQLLETVRGDRLEALFVVALTTGMRQGELLALRWECVDLDAGCARVVGSLARVNVGTNDSRLVVQEPKTARSRRRVELGSLAVTALREHKRRQLEEHIANAPFWQERDLVFCNRTGGYVAQNKLVIHFHQLLRRAGLPDIRFHDLRHTAATLMLARGVHPKVAGDMLGHSTIAVTMDLYSHVTPSMQREAVAALDSLLG